MRSHVSIKGAILEYLLSSRGESWKLEVAGKVRGLEITRIQPRAQQRLS